MVWWYTPLRPRKEVMADVPSPVIYLSYRTPGRLHPDFPAIDVLCFLLGSGRSSLLYRRLVRDGELFAEASASHNDGLDSGSVMIEARPDEDADYNDARTALFATIEELVTRGVTEPQLAKVMNRLEQHNHFKSINISSRASELAFYAALGKPSGRKGTMCSGMMARGINEKAPNQSGSGLSLH